MLPESFVYKEKSGAFTKLKSFWKKRRNQKFKKHNQLYFGTLVLVLYCYCGDAVKNKIRTSFKTLALKKAITSITILQ